MCPLASTSWPTAWAVTSTGRWPATRPSASLPGQVLRKFHSYLFTIPTQQPEESLQEIMEEAIREAHRTVQRDAPGSGTTVTAALVLGQQVTIGHVGDSRLYSIHPVRHVEQLTHDHSLVQRLEELGHLNKEEAAVYPHRNVLIRAVGQGDTIEADIFTIPFPHGLHPDAVHRRIVGRGAGRGHSPRPGGRADACSAPATTWSSPPMPPAVPITSA